MKSNVLYPRVETKEAHRIRRKFVENFDSGIEFNDADFDSVLNGPRAFPPTGGVRIGEAQLRDLRQACIESLDQNTSGSGQSITSSFDITIGKVLFQAGKDSVGEFGDPYVWDFLTLILLPDLAARRMSMGSASTVRERSFQERVTGGARRHVFQRLWKRWLIFGPEIVEGGKLTEDDYGVTIERLITNRPRLARAVAEAIIGSKYLGSERRDYSRNFMVKLQLVSGLVQIPEDDEEYLRDVIDAIHQQTVESIERSR
ncbi:Uncharacterised protein [Brevibacterium casei]|uniref:Uncharacterized protein n=1 Tax=Brevibacterium casei TaxID=33889 RepID=A0A449CZK7_9MICO|nr:hypothetical protein [Brevibacterium casei]VEW10775.1 Uncharacterised protein [Brevibacterium casei]